ncbi:hypothetical protein D3C78_1990210 [compost metagenome]
MVSRKFWLASMTLPSEVNSTMAIERLMALIRLSVSCSWRTRWVMSEATLITPVTCCCAPSTGM